MTRSPSVPFGAGVALTIDELRLLAGSKMLARPAAARFRWVSAGGVLAVVVWIIT